MSLGQAENHFKSAKLYSETSIEAKAAYLPAGAFHNAMAQGMLELTLALKEMSAQLDALESKVGGSGRPGVADVAPTATGGVLVSDAPASPAPESGQSRGGQHSRPKDARGRAPS